MPLLTLSKDVKNLDPLFNCCCIAFEILGCCRPEIIDKRTQQAIWPFGHEEIKESPEVIRFACCPESFQIVKLFAQICYCSGIPEFDRSKMRNSFGLLKISQFFSRTTTSQVAKVGTFHGFPWLRRGSSIQTCPCMMADDGGSEKKQKKTMGKDDGSPWMGSHASPIRSSLAFRSLASKEASHGDPVISSLALSL